ncbi:hypothetical protein JCM9803A_00760 [Rhodococcus erythropolis]
MLPIPLGPQDSVVEVVEFYSSGVHVPLGIALASVGVCFAIPLVSGISYVIWRSGPSEAIFAVLQAVSGTVTAVLLLIPMLIMAVAGFRPDRDPQITLALNDLSWLLFLTPVAPFIIQNIVIGVYVLTANDSKFPRWLGYLNFWVGFTFTFDVLAFAFKDGPFAWNGVFIFWLALTTYSIWLAAMGLTIRKIALSETSGELVMEDSYGHV